MRQVINDLAWRELVAVAEMHARLAREKLFKQSQVDWRDRGQPLGEIGKAIECLGHALANAKKAHVELSAQMRQQSPYAPQGVVSVQPSRSAG